MNNADTKDNDIIKEDAGADNSVGDEPSTLINNNAAESTFLIRQGRAVFIVKIILHTRFWIDFIFKHNSETSPIDLLQCDGRNM